MLARIRKSMEEKDQGFTLIELLVVMIIIGILAAIAIPVFLNQRKKAVDSSLKSDLRTVANEMETYFVDNQNYVGITAASTSLNIGGNTVTLSKGNTVGVVVNATGDKFKVCGYNSNASKAISAAVQLEYNSAAGGLQSATGACAAP